jgi:hypothetical protein
VYTMRFQVIKDFAQAGVFNGKHLNEALRVIASERPGALRDALIVRQLELAIRHHVAH